MKVMKVRILVPGPYRLCQSDGKVTVEFLKTGDEREYDVFYARVLMDNGLAEVVTKTIVASDVARKLAAEHNISLDKIQGSGQDGQITVRDVRKLI